eukprot:CAMPEP_0118673674 /NCGR_PEP_ID=MMETSP0800-20121206/461_1 /TAXON_ID=210618 ORGANISM="Striatella unipunctata, Strain CCMP2910" /NCGR_SAMPLE_ID=MMETSP0800 /ASSEMBLY_ACC=CAM_ASM_000638 /LENGTH=206 /DNA_ID=CAMNT_0006568779 /DNA_START=68 /DNA_END=688 /DNA_ORIENTATION=+
MSGFGELVLVLGDLHIPQRAASIPEKFKKMLVPNKMQHVICTGNLGASSSMYQELRGLAPNMHLVLGDFEDGPREQSLPESLVVQVGMFKIGIIHGHQIIPWNDPLALGMMRRKLGVDVLITGHTHKSCVQEFDDFFHINPGSITGAYSPMQSNVTPSFVLLAVQGPKIVCYVYELIHGEVDVSKTEFTKKEENTAGSKALEGLLQ